MSMTILELIRKRNVLLDGGFGTELIRRGFPQGACPESWNVERPEDVQEIHKSFYDDVMQVFSLAPPFFFLPSL